MEVKQLRPKPSSPPSVPTLGAWRAKRSGAGMTVDGFDKIDGKRVTITNVDVIGKATSTGMVAADRGGLVVAYLD